MRHGNLAIGVLAVVAFSVAGWLIGTGQSGRSTTQTRLPVVAGEVAYAIPEVRTAERSAAAPVTVPPLPSEVAGHTTSTTAPPESTTPPTVAAATEVPPHLVPVTLRAADVPAVDAALLGALNELRATESVGPLTRDERLDALATAWTDTMIDDGELTHSELIYDLVAQDWLAAGENIAFGPTTEGIMAGFENSPEHRANMVNASYDRVGLGTIIVDGVIWTTHLFAG